MSSHNEVKPYQQGAVLLVFIAVLVMTLAWLSYALLGDLGQKLKRQQAQDVGMVLAEAKENLLVFAEMQPSIYNNINLDEVSGIGYLPVPDFDNDGRMGLGMANLNTNTNSDNVIGLFPSVKDGNAATGNGYFFFGFRDGCIQSTPQSCIRDSNMLWYAMSGRSNSPGDIRLTSRRTGVNTRALNSNTLRNELMLNMDGSPLPNACSTSGVVCVDGQPVVAVLLAPGSPLEGQERSSASLSFANYLDMANADSNLYNFVSRYISGHSCASGVSNSSSCFNDRIITITYKEWKEAMERRVKEDENFSSLCSGTLSNNHWLKRNEWHTVSGICP